MFEWIAGTTAGKFISTFFISMLPVVELRAGLPYGIALGLDYPLALTAAVIGNMIPVPFIIIFIQRVFIWLRRHWPKMDSFITKLEAKAHDRSDFRRYPRRELKKAQCRTGSFFRCGVLFSGED